MLHAVREEPAPVADRVYAEAGQERVEGALLGAGVLSAFPLAGFLVAKASTATTILEPALAAALALRRLAERLEALQVSNARQQGWSWQEIADALEVSKQAVHQKHAANAAEPGSGRRKNV